MDQEALPALLVLKKKVRRENVLKILVDEMPKEPYDCPHSVLVTNGKIEWLKCSKSKNDFKCENTSDCPFYKSIHDYKI